MTTSKISPFHYQSHNFYVKRDELMHPLLSGNKYRKLHRLIQTPSHTYHTVISYGGTQSNAMLSLAALCHQKEWRFHYYSKPVVTHLKESPTGNLKAALNLGMQLFEVCHDDYDMTVHNLKHGRTPSKTLLIPQGAADPLAEGGVQALAYEIHQWQQQRNISQLNIVTPSGTGTTAYYLAKSLPHAHVLTTALVGNTHYLEQQMQQLGKQPHNLQILESKKKYHFAQPYAEFLSTYQQLIQAGIEFDLIYASKMWICLLEHIQNIKGTILYVHSGGLIGNETMLKRYKHKGMIHV